MSYSIIVYIICSVVSFYFFYYIDGFLVLLVTSQVLMIICSKKTHAYTIPPIVEKYSIVIYYLLLICIITYISGFRYAISSSDIFPSIRNVFIENNTPPIASLKIATYWNTLKQTLAPYNVQTVSQAWSDRLSQYISKDASGVLIGLITGNKDFIHLALRDLVRRNGISHLLALSGFHLSILIMIFEYSAMIIKKFFKTTLHTLYMNMGIMLAVWIYCIWIGFIPSLYRAALMFSLSVLLKHILGKSNFLVVWFLTGMILMLIYPSIMYAHGFILSMLALLGVVGGAHYSRSITKHIPPFISLPLCIGLGATICTAWYSVLVFGSAYPIGIFVSIILTPLITIFMIVGIVFIASIYLFSSIAVFHTVLILIGKCLDIFIYFVRRVLIFFGNGIVLDEVAKLLLFYMIIFAVFWTYNKVITLQYNHANNRSVWKRTNQATTERMGTGI